MGGSLSRQKRINAILVNGALLLLVIIWTIPTLGLLISSFRPREDVRTTGWWTVFGNDKPLSEDFTLDNYRAVLLGEDTVNADGTVIEALSLIHI